MRRSPIAIAITATLAGIMTTGMSLPADAQQASTTAGTAPSATPQASTLDAIEVTGSRIPRAQIEGPAPVTVMTAKDILANGFTSVPDVLRAMTQNGGETQSQQSFSGGDFSPGAQQVDLRGLGPNHTLVLVNGRRIADFPMPFKGRSNFTDISNIPIGHGRTHRSADRQRLGGVRIGCDFRASSTSSSRRRPTAPPSTYRYGATEPGRRRLAKVQRVRRACPTAPSTQVFGVELLDQKPLWAYDRSLQDSTKDAPTENSRIAAPRVPAHPDYYDHVPGSGYPDTCNTLSYLNGGTTYHAARPRYGDYDPAIDDYGPGYYCGSDESIGYGTILSQRKGGELLPGSL